LKLIRRLCTNHAALAGRCGKLFHFNALSKNRENAGEIESLANCKANAWKDASCNRAQARRQAEALTPSLLARAFTGKPFPNTRTTERHRHYWSA
jgi:hypothetical protein